MINSKIATFSFAFIFFCLLLSLSVVVAQIGGSSARFAKSLFDRLVDDRIHLERRIEQPLLKGVVRPALSHLYYLHRIDLRAQCQTQLCLAETLELFSLKNNVFANKASEMIKKQLNNKHVNALTSL